MPGTKEIRAVLTAAFKEKCKRPFGRGAEDALEKFIAVTVLRAVDLGADFQGRRQYLEDNFQAIGAALNAAADQDKPVSPEELIEAGMQRVEENLGRIERAMERARERGDHEKLEALQREGPFCTGTKRADLQ